MPVSRKLVCLGFFACSFLLFTRSYSQSYVPEYQDARMKVTPVVGLRAFAFDVSDVELLESPFTKAREATVQYLLKIEPDRLLSDFRTHAGLKARAERYGGWESSGLAGHTLGHYLSALALHYAATKNEECLRRVNYMIRELKECQEARRTGYLGAIPKEDSMWAEVAKGNIRSRGFDLNGAWSPWYTVHKIMSGLLDVYLYCGNKEALALNTQMADWAGNLIRNLNDSLVQQMLVTEYGGMNDALVNTYAITGNKKYLELSYRFHDRRVLDSLAMKIDVLSGKHSNTQIPKVIGNARRYQLTGDRKDSTIARFFWETIVHHHTYATGGNSNYEYLGTPDQLNDKLTDNTTETCNTYNMLKLTRELFTITPSAALMDYYEKALYNHILASQDHETGMVTYFVSLRMGGKKQYSNEFRSFTCCVGTGMENHVKYGENIYYRGSDGSVYVNLFIPSVLNYKQEGVQIRQDGYIPKTKTVVFSIRGKAKRAFALRLRKPYWAKKITVSVNGSRQDVSVADDGYIVLSRKWKNGDKIEFSPSLDFYTEAMPDNPNRRAVFYGPVLLAGVLGNREPEPSEVPVFVTGVKDPNQWVKPLADDTLAFSTSGPGTPKEVELIPFNQTRNEYYSVYWDMFTPDEWAVKQKQYEQERANARRLEELTVDILRMGEMQPERDHEFTGEKIFTGDAHNSKFRTAREGGSFSFKMKTDPSLNNTLVCTYWGMDNRGRIFDIFVNDSLLSSEDLNKYKESRFYNISYPIPKTLTENKQEVIIRFVPKPNNSAGPVYNVRTVKGEVAGLLK
jgi:DUF1680 family protein